MIRRLAVFTSIRRKIVLLFIFGLVFPILLSAWMLFRTSRKIIYQHSLEQQDKVLTEISRDIWLLQNQSKRQIRTLGTDPGLMSRLENGERLPNELFLTFLRLNPHWQDLALYNSVGQAVWSSDAGSEKPSADSFFLETFNLFENQTPVFAFKEKYFTRFGFRVDQPATFLGVITASLDLSVIDRTLDQFRSLNNMRAMIWDDRGLVFGSSLPAPEEREIVRQIDLMQAGQEIVNSWGKTFHREIKISQEPVLFSAMVVPEFISRFDPIPGENWFLAIVVPSGRTFAELSGFHSRILVFLLFLFTAVAAVLVWMSRKITHPLEQMASFAEKVAVGKRELRVDVSGEDELASLSKALNSMTVSLQRYERELVRAEVLASMGKMSSLVAHEIRNPLNAIKGSVQYLQLKFPSDPVVTEYCAIVLQKVDRLVHFVDSLLKFARLPAPELREITIQNLFETAIEPFRVNADRQGLAFKLNCNSVSYLLCDREQLLELLQNVIQNATEAMPGDGEFSVSARQDSSFVELELRDNGPGIQPEIADRLFIPFSTGKRGGTGLGLLLCKMIAENHGGSFEYRPAAAGACFVLRIPCG